MSTMPRPRATEPPPPHQTEHFGRACWQTRWRALDGRKRIMRWYVKSAAVATREYRRWLRLWHADPRIREGTVTGGMTVGQLADGYFQWAKQHYVESGQATGHVSKVGAAVVLLKERYQVKPAAKVTPPDLAAWREWIAPGRTAATVNGYLSVVKRMYQWAAERGLVDAQVSAAMREVAYAGRRSKVKPGRRVEGVGLADVTATVAHLQPHLAAMVWLQWHTGMRPGEVCALEGRHLDREGDIWLYRPPRHKTAHRGQGREIAIGPQAQAVLRSYLTRVGYLFRPSDSEQATTAAGERYGHTAYRRAVERACDAAGVPRWTPNQLRHSFATRVKRLLGIDASRVALGHAKADTTTIYLDRDRELAAKVAKEAG